MEETLQLTLHSTNEHKWLLWTAICLQIRQIRENRQIPKNIQPTKT